MSMSKKLIDRHRDIPAEANRDKHINFDAVESDDTDPSGEASTGLVGNVSTEKTIMEKKSRKQNEAKVSNAR